MTSRPVVRAATAAVACSLAASVLLLGAAPVGAQEEAGPVLAVRRVDSSNPDLTTVDFTWAGEPDALGTIAVFQDDAAADASAPVPLADGGGRAGVVFVIDTSASTDNNALLSETRMALNDLIASDSGGHEHAVVTAGGQAAVFRRLASPTVTAAEAIARLTPGGDGALYDGIVRAAAQFEREPNLVPAIVVITDGVTDVTVPLDRARGAALRAGAPVHVIGLRDGQLNEGDLRGLASATGGQYVQTETATDVADLLDQLRPSFAGLYRLTFSSTVERGVTDLTLDVGQSTTRVSFVAGSIATGASQLRLQPSIGGGGGIDFLTGDFGKQLGIGLALAAAALLAWVVIMLFVRDETTLESVIKHYEGYVAPADDDGESGVAPSMAQTNIMQRAVELTTQLAERQGLVTKTESLLERANLPLRAAEALFFYAVGVLLLTTAVMLLSRSILATGLLFIILALAPPAVLNFMANLRRKKFESLLPDTLQLLAGTLRAGYSIMQGVEGVSQEVDEPMGKELRRVVIESRLGRPLEESLEAVAQRMGSKDFDWAVMAIRIQREVGGNLAELLMTVADTMRERERLRREIRALTAEGRMSAIILGVLPVAMAAIIWVINRDYLEPLVDETFGQVMLLAGAGLVIGGFVWMKKIIDIEV